MTLALCSMDQIVEQAQIMKLQSCWNYIEFRCMNNYENQAHKVKFIPDCLAY